MRLMDEQQASQQVRDYAATVAAMVGVDAASTETRVGSSPCQSASGELAQDGRFYVQGNWQMPLVPAEHAATLVRLHDTWAAQGYEIKKFQMFDSISGMIIAMNPADEVEVAVESAIPPIAVAVVVMTPCYRY